MAKIMKTYSSQAVFLQNKSKMLRDAIRLDGYSEFVHIAHSRASVNLIFNQGGIVTIKGNAGGNDIRSGPAAFDLF